VVGFGGAGLRVCYVLCVFGQVAGLVVGWAVCGHAGGRPGWRGRARRCGARTRPGAPALDV